MSDIILKIARENKIKKTTKKKNEIAIIINDTIRLITVFASAHVLQTLLHQENKLFNTEFIKTVVYLLVGTIIYHILVKKHTELEEE
jgi:uncharacterized membrane protein